MSEPKLIYRDEHICVIEKPAGISSEAQMIEKLKQLYALKAYAVHRLDKEAGGLMVYALNSEAAAGLSSAIAAGEFKKIYLAVVIGHMPEASGTLEDYLYHDKNRNKSYSVKAERKGVKYAKLEYSVLSEREPDGICLSLVRIRLHTGRTHQIRVQFSSRRHPLYGDGRYGGKAKASGLCLWSHELGFSHPTTGERMEFTLAPPEVFPWTLFELSSND